MASQPLVLDSPAGFNALSVKFFLALARMPSTNGEGGIPLHLSAPISRFGAALRAMPALALWLDLCPAPASGNRKALRACDFATDEGGVWASSCARASTVRGPLADVPSSWVSLPITLKTPTMHWCARLAEPAILDGVTVTFNEGSLPAAWILEAQLEPVHEAPWILLRRVDEAFVSASTTLRLVPPPMSPVYALRLAFTGHHVIRGGGGIANGGVALDRVTVWVQLKALQSPAAASACQVLTSWLRDAAAVASVGGCNDSHDLDSSGGSVPAAAAAAAASGASPATALHDAALAALLRLALVSGSARTLLQAASALLAAPQRFMLPAAGAGGAALALLTALRRSAALERARQGEGEYGRASGGLGIARAAAGGTGAVAGSWGPVPGAAFDRSAASPGVEFSNGDLTVTSSLGDNQYAAVNVGPFTEGRAAWTFVLDDDTTSQCSCFGAAVRPVTSAAYDRSEQLLMLRAYNGFAYQFGETNLPGSSGEPGDCRVQKGDTVRLELDFDAGAGEMRVFINGVDKGRRFDNLRGRALYPAVAFYSKDRSISLVSVEADLRKFGRGFGGSASAAVGASGVASGVAKGVAGGGLTAVAAAAGAVAPYSAVGASRSISLLSLPIESWASATGELGRHGDSGVGKPGSDSRRVRVDGTQCIRALAMLPPAVGAGLIVGAARSANAPPVTPEEIDAATLFDDDANLPEDYCDGTGDGDGVVEGVAVDARLERARALAAACDDMQQAGGPFAAGAGAASAVFWLGGRFESLTGRVALNDTATADLRASADASPVFFETYGDGNVLLWRSEPLQAARVPPRTFVVPVLGVRVLRLVVRVARGAAGAHAVWLEPLLSTASEWCAGGWRNRRTALVDALSRVPRGADAPLPDACTLLGIEPAFGAAEVAPPADAVERTSGEYATAASSDIATGEIGDEAAENWPPAIRAQLRTTHSVGVLLLIHAGLLARELLRGMRRLPLLATPVGPVAAPPAALPVALLVPFVLEPSAGLVADVAALIDCLTNVGKGSGGDGSGPTGLSTTAATEALAALISVLTANLRRVAACGITAEAAGLALGPAALPAAEPVPAALLPAQRGSKAASATVAGAKGSIKSSGSVAQPASAIAPAPAPSSTTRYVLSPALADLMNRLYEAAEWGGDAAGRRLLARASTTANSPLLAAPRVQAAIWELLDLAAPVLLRPRGRAAARQALVRAHVPAGAVLEMQLDWPCEEAEVLAAAAAGGSATGAAAGTSSAARSTSAAEAAQSPTIAPLPLEALLVLLQLAAAREGLRSRLVGRWPARIYLLINVDASACDGRGLIGFLDGPLAQALNELALSAWWASDAAADTLPLILERSPHWNRVARAAVEPGAGALRIYPDFTGNFDAVLEGLLAFLPPDEA